MTQPFRMARLGDLLPHGVIEDLFLDMESRLVAGDDESVIQKDVVSRLEPLRKGLEAKGVLAGELASWLVWRVGSGVSATEAPSAAFRPATAGV